MANEKKNAQVDEGNVDGARTNEQEASLVAAVENDQAVSEGRIGNAAVNRDAGTGPDVARRGVPADGGMQGSR